MQLDYLRVDEQLKRLHDADACVDPRIRTTLTSRFDACWIYHDLSIEGAIFRDNELERALAGHEGRNWREHQLLEKVRYMRRAIAFVREQARRGRTFDLDFVKDIHRQLRPDNEEAAGRYRKDSGESCAYRHDIVAPKTISYRLRRLIAFVESTDPFIFGHPIGMACHIHQELAQIFPFANDNGLVMRLAMNFWIMRYGYPPAVIHIHDRQRYFDCYLSENGDFRRLVLDSVAGAADAMVRGLQGGGQAAHAAA